MHADDAVRVRRQELALDPRLDELDRGAVVDEHARDVRHQDALGLLEHGGPLGRVADAEEVAETIRWLASDAPASLTGSTLDINGASYVR